MIDNTRSSLIDYPVNEMIKMNKDSTIDSFSDNDDHIFKNYNIKGKNSIVLDKAYKVIPVIEDGILKERAAVFINEFSSVLRSFCQDNDNPLPQLSITICTDNSIFIEWKFDYFRFGFSIEMKDDDSYWYLVSNRKMEEINVSGDLPENKYNSVLLRVVDFVLRNT
jgi:hypothetical protein